MSVLVGKGPAVAIRDERLSVTDPRIGAVPDSADDQGSVLQDAIDLAATADRGTLFFPAGEYRNNSVELTFPTDTPITLLGVGGFGDSASPSIIHCATDQGTGTAAVIADGSTVTHTIEKLTLYGPRAAVLAHDFPADMVGVESTGQVRIVDSNIIGFWAGLTVMDPEATVVATYLEGNGHGIFYRAGSTGGSVLLDRVALDSQAISGICIDEAATARNITMIQCHLGQGSAYCFFRPGTPDTPATELLMLENLVADQCSFESPSNGILYDQTFTSEIRGLTFLGDPEANIMGATNYPTIARVANWYCDTIRDFFVYALVPLSESAYPMMKARTIENVGLFDPQFFLSDAANRTTYPAGKFQIVSGGDGINGVQVGFIHGGGQFAGAHVASGAISQWDLVQMDAERTVKTHTGDVADRVVGVALHDCDADDVCHYWTGGRFTDCKVKVASGVTVTQWKDIKADPDNPGCVVEATSMADANIVGKSYWGLTGPDVIDAKLRLR